MRRCFDCGVAGRFCFMRGFCGAEVKFGVAEARFCLLGLGFERSVGELWLLGHAVVRTSAGL